MKRGNRYELSNGNLAVLINIPKMMRNLKYRKQLRKLTLEFLFEDNNKNIEIKSRKRRFNDISNTY